MASFLWQLSHFCDIRPLQQCGGRQAPSHPFCNSRPSCQLQCSSRPEKLHRILEGSRVVGKSHLTKAKAGLAMCHGGPVVRKLGLGDASRRWNFSVELLRELLLFLHHAAGLSQWRPPRRSSSYRGACTLLQRPNLGFKRTLRCAAECHMAPKFEISSFRRPNAISSGRTAPPRLRVGQRPHHKSSQRSMSPCSHQLKSLPKQGVVLCHGQQRIFSHLLDALQESGIGIQGGPMSSMCTGAWDNRSLKSQAAHMCCRPGTFGTHHIQHRHVLGTSLDRLRADKPWMEVFTPDRPSGTEDSGCEDGVWVGKHPERQHQQHLARCAEALAPHVQLRQVLKELRVRHMTMCSSKGHRMPSAQVLHAEHPCNFGELLLGFSLLGSDRPKQNL